MKWHHTFLYLTFVILSACQSFQGKQTDTSSSFSQINNWESHQQLLEAQKQWQIKGKIGFSFPHKEKTKLVSANIDWKRDNNEFVMDLSGPLGMNAFKLEKSPEQTVLTNHKDKQFKSSSPERLFYTYTGMQIPWSDLEWWVLGIPKPGKAYKKSFFEEEGAFWLGGLEQSAWKVTYLSYHNYQGVRLPQKMKFQQGELKATLVVKEWTLTKWKVKQEMVEERKEGKEQ
jgi:outer membrane lipoprotein LolB